MTIVSILFFGLMFVGLPIGYVLGLAGVAGLVQVGGENFLTMAPKRYFEGLDLFTFMAMPFFILAGEIMNRSGTPWWATCAAAWRTATWWRR